MAKVCTKERVCVGDTHTYTHTTPTTVGTGVAAKRPRVALSLMTRGVSYFKGLEGEQDYVMAVECFTKLAEQGNRHARLVLALCYDLGVGVEQDRVTAMEWFKTTLDEESNAEVLEWFAKPARGTCAVVELGLLYFEGERESELEQDYVKAAKWFVKAAEGGNPGAQFKLGLCYQVGVGVEKDDVKAAEWFMKAAGGGHTDSQFSVAECFADGKGVEPDQEKAAFWFAKSEELADQRHSERGGRKYKVWPMNAQKQAEACQYMEAGSSVPKKTPAPDHLFTACQKREWETVRRLLEEGADPNLTRDGKTVLMCDLDDNAEVANLLLENRAKIHHKDHQGRTALYTSAEGCCEDILHLLLQRGADANHVDEQGRTPLHAACSHGMDVTAKLLLDHGANINQQDKHGYTALFFACGYEVSKRTRARADHERCFWDTITMLVENGADINHTDKSGHTALSLACRSGNEKSVKLLLGKEARIDLAGQQFGLMAHHCVAFNGQEHILKLLLEKRAAANAVDKRGQTPLHLAASRGMHQTARLLLTHGANINQTDNMGRTALFHMCEFNFKKSDEESKLLLEHGACCFEASAKLLLEHGASTDIKDRKQQLPLSRALANGASLNLVTMLSNANSERKCAMKSAEVQRLQDQLGAVQDQLDAEQQCFICNGARKSIVFNCGHQVCETCSIRINNDKCPFCREIVRTRTKMHDS